MRNVFIAGATGYMGSRLAVELLRRGHAVFGLVRPGSERRLPNDCHPVPGNALDRSSFSGKILGTDPYVQLVGVAHPGPSKAEQFRQIDLKSCQESVAAALANKVQHSFT